MNFLLKIIDTINEWFGKAVSFLILPIVGILVFITLIRYGFSASTLWSDQISLFLTGPYFILGGAYTLLHNGHVNMDVVYNRFSRRVRAILDLFTAMLFFLFSGLFFWKAVGYSLDSLAILETTGSTLYFPLYPIKLIIPVAPFLLFLQGVPKFIRNLNIAIKGESYEY
jgi:TRAP-type mannitol/chloroaromatic compound transport system permease small subunit